MTLVLLHNPRCSKSRGAKSLLDEAGVDFEIREYLNDPLSATEVLALATALNLAPADMTRPGDVRALNLATPIESLSDSEVAELIAGSPKLLERPVLWRNDGKAVIGRPPENIQSLL